MRFKFVIAAMAALPVTLLAYPTGPPIKRTGGVDGNINCTACHRTYAPANSDPAGSVTISNLNPYVPGTLQTLQVTVQHPQASRWGFQLTARFVTGGGTIMAGSFAPVDVETKVVCDDGSELGSPGPCQANQLQWIEHANAPRTSLGAGHTFSVTWTPPPDENGDIMLYVAGNAANGDDTFNGDRIYTNTYRVPLSTNAACPLTKQPAVRTAVNAAPHAGPFSWNSMVEIYGSDFQAGSRMRTVGLGDLVNGKFPQALSCIAVEIDGTRVPVTYVQQDQINVQAPTTSNTGPVTLRVIANPGRPNELRSEPATITLSPGAPGLFTFGSTKSIAAQFAGTADIVADPSIVPGARPAKPGDIVTLYGTGFGNTSPVWQAGEISTGQSPCTGTPTVTIGGTTLAASDVLYAGLSPQSISGLYQFNVRIPSNAPDGDLPVVITLSGASTQTGATIPVKTPQQ
jgi:uncharacterized protein (TIGR03437 family)